MTPSSTPGYRTTRNCSAKTNMFILPAFSLNKRDTELNVYQLNDCCKIIQNGTGQDCTLWKWAPWTLQLAFREQGVLL